MNYHRFIEESNLKWVKIKETIASGGIYQKSIPYLFLSSRSSVVSSIFEESSNGKGVSYCQEPFGRVKLKTLL